jgi:transposase
MQAVYGDECVDVCTVRRWVREFKQEVGEANLCDKVRSRRPASYKLYVKKVNVYLSFLMMKVPDHVYVLG